MMKKFSVFSFQFSVLLAASAALLCAPLTPTASGQTLAPTTMTTNYVPTGNGFVDKLSAFVTQADTGYGTFVGKTCDIWIGSCFEQNINADGIIGIDYTVYDHVEIDGNVRIWNSAQTIKSIGVGPAVGFVIGDVKFETGVDLVERFDTHHLAVGPFIQGKKGTGPNTYVQLRLQSDYEIASRKAQQLPFLGVCFGINLGKKS